jgi:hypothetical protein
MSTVAIPTKPSGNRPPTLPPSSTTFDGASGGDSWIVRLTDEVRRMCRFADAAEGDDLEHMISLIDIRRAMVINETMSQNALGDFPLPPVSNIPIDFLLSPTKEQRILQDLLNQLDDCRARCERRLARHRFEVRLSKDLEASDS